MQRRLQNHIKQILGVYKTNCERYDKMRERAENLIRDVVPHSLVHTIQSRVKKSDSLSNKIVDKTYKSIDQITDIVGIRVITFFADDAARVAKIIRKEFVIDEKQSSDKSLLLDPDRFGYLSLQFVAYLTPQRRRGAEYRYFQNDPVEIQVRSILQHAWAEIQHDRGYKSKDNIPIEIRRRFSRLAGLLELGDSEFQEIRDKINAINAHMKSRIQHLGSPIKINRDSIAVFIMRSQIVRRIDSALSHAVKLPLVQSDTFVELFASRLRMVGFETIGEVEKALRRDGDRVQHFLAAWYEMERGRVQPLIPRGISLSFLCWMRILDEDGPSGLEKVLAKHAFNKNLATKKTAAELDIAYQRSKSAALR